MSSETPITDFSKRCEILDKFWMEYREEETFESYVEYNDLALPLAFAINEDIVKSTPIAEAYVNEAWELLCEVLEIDKDKFYESLEDMFVESGGF
jgi:hypothetical protein